MDIKKKNEADGLVTFFVIHRMANPTRADAAMLSTLCHMVADGDKDIALYILETLGEPQASMDEDTEKPLSEIINDVMAALEVGLGGV